MRLALVGPTFPLRGGIAHYTDELYRALRLEHDVLLVSFRRLYPKLLYPGRSEREPVVSFVEASAGPRLDSLNPVTWFAALKKISQSGAAAVILQWWTTFLAPVFFFVASAGRLKQLKVIFVVHNVLPHERRPLDPVLSRAVLGLGHAFLVQTDQERQRLIALLGRVPPTETYPHPAYDLYRIPGLTRAEARRRLGLPADQTILLFFGFVRPYKGLQYLVESLRVLHQRGVPAHLAVVGEFWEPRARYERQAAALGLEGFVSITDRYVTDEEAGLYLAAADVLAAPYIGGTQSGVVPAALKLGLPCVVTETIAEALSGYEAGLLRVVPPADGAGLADGVMEILARPRTHASGGQSQTDSPTWEGLASSVARLARV